MRFLDIDKTLFTSDPHFGHKNICRLAGRPFDSVEQMNWEIITRWNHKVTPDKTVIVVGDAAMGDIQESLDLFHELNGYKILVLGNHDRPFMTMGKASEARWRARYEEVFHELWGPQMVRVEFSDGTRAGICHFPYDGDSHGEERYKAFRPIDDGLPLIHGHTHSTEYLADTALGTAQVHVGVDAWNFAPIRATTVVSLINA